MNDGREPKVLDKGCYWLICVPVRPDSVGWQWRGWVWRKGDDQPLTSWFKKDIEAIEVEAAKLMNCGGLDS